MLTRSSGSFSYHTKSGIQIYLISVSLLVLVMKVRCCQNGDCVSSTCKETNGPYLCWCPENFVMKPDGRTCFREATTVQSPAASTAAAVADIVTPPTSTSLSREIVWSSDPNKNTTLHTGPSSAVSPSSILISKSNSRHPNFQTVQNSANMTPGDKSLSNKKGAIVLSSSISNSPWKKSSNRTHRITSTLPSVPYIPEPSNTHLIFPFIEAPVKNNVTNMYPKELGITSEAPVTTRLESLSHKGISKTTMSTNSDISSGNSAQYVPDNVMNSFLKNADGFQFNVNGSDDFLLELLTIVGKYKNSPAHTVMEASPTNSVVEQAPINSLTEPAPSKNIIESAPTSKMLGPAQNNNLLEPAPINNLMKSSPNYFTEPTHINAMESASTNNLMEPVPNYMIELTPINNLMEPIPNYLMEPVPTNNLMEQIPNYLMEPVPTKNLMEPIPNYFMEPTKNRMEPAPHYSMKEMASVNKVMEPASNSNKMELASNSNKIELVLNSNKMEPAANHNVMEVSGNVGCGNTGCINGLCEEDLSGFFSCRCFLGFQPSSNSTVCLPYQHQDSRCGSECVNGNCIRRNGVYACACNPGYTYTGWTCVDINECMYNSACNGGECYNYQGGYHCRCYPGYYVQEHSYGRQCEKQGKDLLGSNSWLWFLMMRDAL